MSWTTENNQIYKEYSFLNFPTILDFIDKISFIFKQNSLSPEIQIKNNQIKITLSAEESNQIISQKIEYFYTELNSAVSNSVDLQTNKKIYLTTEKRLRNQLLLGIQGSGKSMYLKQILISDIQRKRGVCLIDTQDNLINDIFSNLTDEQKSNTVILDFAKENNFSLNFLDTSLSGQESLDCLLELFKKFAFLDEKNDPILESYISNALLLLKKSEKPQTLKNLLEVFTKEEFRKELLATVNDLELLTFWQITTQNPSNLLLALPYILSSVNQFTTNQYLNDYFLSTKPLFDFASFINAGKNLLIKLPVNVLGQKAIEIISYGLINRLSATINQRNRTNTEYFLYLDNLEKYCNYDLFELMENSKNANCGFVLSITSLRKIAMLFGESVVDEILASTQIHTVFKSEFFDAELLQERYSELVDLETIKDPAKFTGFLFIDNEMKLFEF